MSSKRSNFYVVRSNIKVNSRNILFNDNYQKYFCKIKFDLNQLEIIYCASDLIFSSID